MPNKVIDSDGTLIFNIGAMKTGTALTAKIARENNKPLMVIQSDYFIGFNHLSWMNLIYYCQS